MQYLDLGSFIKEADLVITAEGSLDGQTPFGKVPAEVASRAKKTGKPVLAHLRMQSTKLPSCWPVRRKMPYA
ncbi:hypothetical protein BLA27_14895 [Brucella cytisi]|uniref:Uncharacterized protein n=1 Tax=Brucella cytisi TaxID=407152 RepID=A0A1J6HI93_9HYPH|nr:hypothetical protein BLA27_14895 [Brucella cytisi]